MEQIKLDIVPVGVAPVAHASQFDNGRQIRFNLFNQGTPYTLTGAETVTMVVNGEEENITNTSDNYVIWDVAEEDCEEVGVIGCEIRIVLGSMLIGSKNFFLEVEMDPYNGKNIRIVTVGPADICMFETNLPEPLQSVTVDVEATGGNGTPENPNPINGYTEANITRCGVNLITGLIDDGKVPSISDGSLVASAGSRSDYIKVKSSTEYSFIVETTQGLYMFYYDENKTYISYDSVNNNTHMTKTTPVNCRYVMLRTAIDNLTVSTFAEGTHTQLIPYNGQTYTIAFGQTVYGGVLDVTRGKLHVTWANLTFAELSTKGWNLSGSGVFYLYPIATAMPDILLPIVNNPLCSSFAYQPGGAMENNTFRISDALYIKTDEAATAVDFKTWLANNTGSFVYELATPFDIDLTPEVISAIVGENNVFADCGETTVKYLKAGV